MIEVKTTNNYKLGKTTINQRIGEDFEPDKPIINYNQQAQAQNNKMLDSIVSPELLKQRRNQSTTTKMGVNPKAATMNLGAMNEISDERLEEIKMQHYNRKIKDIGNSPGGPNPNQ